MFTSVRRPSASKSLLASSRHPSSASPIAARAVVVRGTVTDPLGAVVGGARVQLIQGKQAVAAVLTNPDGSFEIRSASPGRFVLLTSAPNFTPNIGQDFYGGATDVVTRDVVLEIAAVTDAPSPSPPPESPRPSSRSAPPSPSSRRPTSPPASASSTTSASPPAT